MSELQFEVVRRTPAGDQAYVIARRTQDGSIHSHGWRATGQANEALSPADVIGLGGLGAKLAAQGAQRALVRWVAHRSARGAPPPPAVDTALKSVEDAFGQGRVLRSDGRSFVARSEDGTKTLRLDTEGHGYDPHFHLQNAPTKGRPTDLLDKHMYFFRKTP